MQEESDSLKEYHPTKKDKKEIHKYSYTFSQFFKGKMFLPQKIFFVFFSSFICWIVTQSIVLLDPRRSRKIVNDFLIFVGICSVISLFHYFFPHLPFHYSFGYVNLVYVVVTTGLRDVVDFLIIVVICSICTVTTCLRDVVDFFIFEVICSICTVGIFISFDYFCGTNFCRYVVRR